MSKVDPESIRALLPENQRAQPPFFFPAEQIQKFVKDLKCTVQDLGRALAQLIAPFALAPLSEFHVGACTFGQTGNAYLGVNMEFTGTTINQNVHAEQCAITNAWLRGEKQLVRMCTTETPCGHCRQFMAELPGFDEFEICVVGKPTKLIQEFLPEAFRPVALNIDWKKINPFISTFNNATLDSDISSLPENQKSLVNKTFDAFKKAYSPFQISQTSPSAAGIRLKNGDVFSAGYLENIAFNPSMMPLNAALVAMLTQSHNHDWSQIESCVLLEDPKSKVQQSLCAKSFLCALSQNATFSSYQVSVDHKRTE
ncbi:putative Cytidine deaminase [Blattamonas nauphoetae]|uniref:Cytidine deaminase n=1 Tax=Blattamonas nauphoetae TaxID=2049346 RepID=A0ABQ9X3X1_9EUKA|nr:putative Cytidine deaminase [Blattamonas nauphoetae]